MAALLATVPLPVELLPLELELLLFALFSIVPPLLEPEPELPLELLDAVHCPLTQVYPLTQYNGLPNIEPQTPPELEDELPLDEELLPELELSELLEEPELLEDEPVEEEPVPLELELLLDPPLELEELLLLTHA